MDDIESNLTQDANAWNSIKYEIDPTLGTFYCVSAIFQAKRS